MSEWRPVLEYEDCYAISDDGAAVRTSTYGKNPKPVRKPVAKRIKRHGYICFHFCKDGVRKDVPAHRLVWEAFNGPIPNGFEINHKNGIRTDNRLANLECITRSENMKHKFRVLKSPSPSGGPGKTWGAKHPSSKLTDEAVREILAMHRSGERNSDIAKKFEVSKNLIGFIVKGRVWKHLTLPSE